MIDEQITSLVKSFFVMIAAVVLNINSTTTKIMFIVVKTRLSEVIEGANKYSILKINALNERLFVPRSLFSFDIKPPRFSVNSVMSLRSLSKKKKDIKNIAKK